MYRQFFGFSERPFKLVPDPDYLFLSKSHEEALSHLKYAVDHGEGFVEIIGEVGCGKTMLCRAFLEGLGPDTESAYIFNPKMDANDLLCAINDEFGVVAESGGTKVLIDALNLFLMEKKVEGKKAILVIDEAQNLKKDVLEQIRLLSNLETTKEKLLSIILVGQPELGEMLDSQELRQLSQRISLSCVLRPLSYKETFAYIRHRIFIASRKSEKIFSRAAVRGIYKYSQGIPRLINVCCDRVLLTAYGFNRRRISGRITAAAIKELMQRGGVKKAAGRNLPNAFILAGLILICGLLLLNRGGIPELSGFFRSHPVAPAVRHSAAPVEPAPGQSALPQESGKAPENSQPDIPELKTAETTDTADPAETVSQELQESQSFTELQKPQESRELQNPRKPQASQNLRESREVFDRKGFNGLLENLTSLNSRSESAAVVLDKWNFKSNIPEDIARIKDDPLFFETLARQNGLVSRIIDGDLDLALNLDLCAVLRFASPRTGGYVYLTLTGISPDGLLFSDPAGPGAIITPLDVMIRYWTGKAFVFWKEFYNYRGIIPTSAPGESIITLKMHLREMGYKQVGISPVYDPLTRSVIKAIQAAHHIPADGYVGPLTRIVLYNDNPALPIPRLKRDPDQSEGADIKKHHEAPTQIPAQEPVL